MRSIVAQARASGLRYPVSLKVRIRFQKGTRLGAKSGRYRRDALFAGALLTPAAVLAWVLALWRIAADLNWASGFAIPAGFFSHWQVWFAAGALLQLCARILNRYGKGGDPAAS